MNSPTNNKLYYDLLEDYTTTDEKVGDEVEDFLNGFEDLTTERREIILRALRRKGVDTVKKLEEELLRVGPDIAKSFEREEMTSKPDADRPSPLSTVRLKAKDKINSENVGLLLERFSKHPSVKMLLELQPRDQVKALNKAGILFVGQFDVTNDISMHRLKDAVGSVLSGITPTKGATSFEISTPTGSGRNR
jgi:hypothetical protein